MSNFIRFLVGGKKDDEKKDDSSNEQQPQPTPQQPASQPEKKVEESLSPEQIRLKRLERLQGGTSNVNAPQQITAPAKPTSQPVSVPTKTTQPVSIGGTSPVKSTLSSSPMKTSLGSSPASKLSSSPMKKDPMDVDSTGGSPMSKVIPEEKYINDLTTKVFKATMYKKLATSNFYLEGLATQMMRDSQSLNFIDGQAEAVLVERLAAGFGDQSPLTYLFECYKRASDEVSREENKLDKIESRINKTKEIKKLIVSYTGIVLTDTDMFPTSDKIRYLINNNILTFSQSRWTITICTVLGE
jgi:hypothetical protein